MLNVFTAQFKMAEEKKDFPTMERDFSKVILTLDNVLIPDERLETTPSMQDGLDKDIEQDLRILGCELIQTAGILLKLPQVAMAAGQVIFQRFYYSKSFVKHNMEVVAMASINLASKIEECPRRMRDVINVFHHVKQIKSGKTISPLILDQNYINLKNQVIKAERRLLKELGFCVHVKHPHKIIVMYLTVLECERNTTLVQRAWNYMNDSFRTNVFMRYRPEAIACACIFLASRELQVPLPNNPAWYEIFDVGQAQVEDICITLLKLYARKKPNPEELEKVVNEVKKIHIEAKLKAKGMRSAGTTPNSSSRPVSPAVKFGQSPAASKTGRSEDEKSDESAGRSKENHLKKKRSYSQSPVNSRSRSRSRSRSYHSSSRSSSGSPSQKHRHRSPRKKHKKNSYLKEKHYKERHRKRSVSRSRSHSPDKRRYAHKKHYKERSRYRSRSRSRSPERYRPNKKHSSNGHRYSRSRSRERYRR